MTKCKYNPLDQINDTNTFRYIFSVHHLQTLACEVFPAQGAGLKLLSDLKATYGFLQERVNGNQEILANLRSLKVFLNVDNATNLEQAWHFVSAKELAIGQEYDFPEKNLYAVRVAFETSLLLS